MTRPWSLAVILMRGHAILTGQLDARGATMAWQNGTGKGESTVMILEDGEARQLAVKQLAEQRIAHQDLDAAIAALIEKGAFDDLQLQRLKRQKLKVKDEILRLEGLLMPDIIA